MAHKILVVICVLFISFTEPVSASVKIHAALPNPENEAEEWIEIINTGTDSIDITGLQIDDEPEAGSKPFIIPTSQLSAAEIRRFSKSETGITLNNSKQKDQPYADVIRLLDSTSSELDRLQYISAQTGEVITPTPAFIPTSTPLPTAKPSPAPSPDPTFTPTPKPAPSPANNNSESIQAISVSPTGTILSVSQAVLTDKPDHDSKNTDLSHSDPHPIAFFSLVLGSALISISGLKSFFRLRKRIHKLK